MCICICMYMHVSARVRVMISTGCAADLFFRTCVDAPTAGGGGGGYLINTCLHTCLEGKCSRSRRRYWGTPRKQGDLTIVTSSFNTWRLRTKPELDKLTLLAYKPNKVTHYSLLCRHHRQHHKRLRVQSCLVERTFPEWHFTFQSLTRAPFSCESTPKTTCWLNDRTIRTPSSMNMDYKECEIHTNNKEWVRYININNKECVRYICI